MATTLRMKRMLRERPILEKPNDDFFVYFKDENLFTFHAYVFGPADTLYAHKFVKLKIEIPEKYPLTPPKCTFVQHSGGRIHPNLYVEGKVCLSILGTWPGEPWALAMSVETVLITVRSLLDNSPYKHEPGQKDNIDFNHYVQYTTWKSLLIDYFRKESEPPAKVFLQSHISQHGKDMINELEKQATANSARKQLNSPYERWSGGSQCVYDYKLLLKEVIEVLNECQVAEAARQEMTVNMLPTEVRVPEIEDDSTASNAAGYPNEKKAKLARSIPMTAAAIVAEAVGPSPYLNGIISTSGVGAAIPILTQVNSQCQASPLKRKYEVIDLT